MFSSHNYDVGMPMRYSSVRGGCTILAYAFLPLAFAGCEARPGRQEAMASAFQHMLGGPGTEVGNSVREVSDGGFIIVGYTSSGGAGQEDVYLLRTDAAGDTLWTRTIGGPGNDFGWDILEARDGGYVIVGFTNSVGAGGDAVYVIRTGPTGTVLWERTYGGPEDERAWAFHRTGDGGYVIAAQTASFGAGDLDVYLLRIDAAGDTIWTRTLGGPGVDRVFATEPTADGGSVFAGITNSEGAGDIDAYLIRVDATGDLLWARTFGGAGRDIGHGVTTAPDGGFLLVGYTSSYGAGNHDIYLVRTDAVGAMRWRRVIGDAGDDRAMMAAAMPGGGYAIAGYSTGTAQYWDIRLTAVNEDGRPLWSENFGGPGTDRGVMLQPTSDGAYIITGGIYRESDGAPDLFLAKVRAPG